MTASLATSFERVPNRDSRRMMFVRQIELLAMLSPAWAARKGEEHALVLAKHPFDDRNVERANVAAALRASGTSKDDAWQRVCQQFPLPQVAPAVRLASLFAIEATPFASCSAHSP